MTFSRVRARTSVAAVLASVLMTIGFAGSMPAAAGPKVVGGTQTSTSEFPFAVYLTNATGFQFCGGTLVKPNKVVTAAHCTIDQQADNIRVVAGRDDKESTTGSVARVSKVWLHPAFQNVEKGYDVSVLTLSSDLDYRVLDLAGPDDSAHYAESRSAMVLGWGTTSEGGAASRYLMRASVPLNSTDTCRSAYTTYDGVAMVCAGHRDGGTDTCQGDSGGPLIVDGKLIGITSWGHGCARKGLPGVYTRVASYAADVREQL